MSVEPIVALVGRRDEPTDGVADYCAWLGGSVGEFGYGLETVRLEWQERGWRAALADLQEKTGAWRGRWVLLQYTTLAWSRRGFPLQAPRILSVLRKSGVRCGVVFHDFAPFVGKSVVGRVREFCHIRVLESLYRQSERAIFTVPLEKVRWLPPARKKAVYIPVGANCPGAPRDASAPSGNARTVAVYCIDIGNHMVIEIGDMGHALKRAQAAVGPLQLIVLGRGAREAASMLQSEFAGTGVGVETLGLLSPEDVSRTLARSDVMLFVRGQISSRRGSAIAGIACGLPIVCYAGPDTAWPITEAGILPVPMSDRDALASALERVLTDDALRATLAERSRRAYAQYFSWHAIAACYADVLGKRAEEAAGSVAGEHAAVTRTR
jgi:glycosyltransferase involved in cell wall biosynthesis